MEIQDSHKNKHRHIMPLCMHGCVCLYSTFIQTAIMWNSCFSSQIQLSSTENKPDILGPSHRQGFKYHKLSYKQINVLVYSSRKR
jgi:hypothetical protein